VVSEVSLDDPGSYRRLDPDDMYRRVADLPAQIETAWRLTGQAELPDGYREARSVLISGMGGSAIGGSLLQAYGAGEMPVPLEVWRGYGLPAYVGEDTLVIAISYSGNTEETLSSFAAAKERGAKLLAISTGGRLAEQSAAANIPTVRFSYPAQPRATLGYLFTPLIRIFERLGFLSDQEQAVQESIQVAKTLVRDYGAEQPTDDNRAKQLARALHGKGAVIYGGEYLAAVARRWKTQMNENAKTWGFYEELSELNHNAIVGYEYPESLRDNLRVVVLDGTHLSDRVRLRMKVTQELMDRYGVSWEGAEARGSGKLAQMFSLIGLGDFVTYYLALLNGADPTSIEPIDYLKEALAKG
jgi:glucose/mannose-6-phosphate isomerase